MVDQPNAPPRDRNSLEHLLNADSYLALMRDLDALKSAVGEDGQPCSAILKSTAAVQAVIQFLQADPVVHQLALHAPLMELAAALYDRMQGARPAMFEVTGASRTKPTNLHSDIARGQIVAALNTVIKAGMSVGDAKAWLQAEMRSLGFPAGTHKEAIKWRERVSDGTAPQLQKLAASEIFKDQTAAIANGVPEAKRAAQALLLGAKQHDFPQSPGNSGKQP